MANGAELATAYLAIGDAVGTISERYYFAGRLSEGLRVIGHGLALAEAQEAPVGMRAGLLVQEGKLRSLENFQGLGDFDQTLDVLERARQTAVDANSRQLEADAVDLTGMTHYYRALAQGGEYDAARELFERALEMRAQLDDSRGLAETEFHIGLIHQNTGRWPEARQWFERAIDRARSDGHKLELSYAVRHLGFVCHHEGDAQAAYDRLAESLALREEIGFRIFLPFSLLALVELDRQEGRLEAARDGATRAREIAVEIRSPSQAVFALVALGDVDATAGDSAAARANYEQALSEAREAALERGVALAASKLADLDKRV